MARKRIPCIHDPIVLNKGGRCIECVREYDRRRIKEQPQRWELRRRVVTEWRARNPDGYRAHNAVNNAVRDGKLKKPEACQRCGSTSHIHGHHEDYAKPLDVIWLCALCHHGDTN